MVNINKRYVAFDYERLSSKEKKNLKLDEVFITFDGKAVALSKLFVVTKSEDKESIRSVISIEDFLANVRDDVVCVNGIKTDIVKSTDFKLCKQVVPDPVVFHSTSINPEGKRIPYGLKRTLKVEEASTTDTNTYRYVKQDGNWTFLREDEMFYLDGSDVKTFKDLIASGKDISSVELFDKNYGKISEIYTGKKYVFKSLVVCKNDKGEDVEARETVNFRKNLKTSYQINDDGKIQIFSVEYEPYITEQEYVQFEEPKPNSSKMQIIHKRKVRNFQANEHGKFVAVTINGQIKMVDAENLYDDLGNPITDLSKMLGEVVKIKEDGVIVATSDPLTYEQANRRFDTIKTHQESSAEVTESSMLRLRSGKYVKELDTVEPISFKLAEDTSGDFDRWLVEQTIGSIKKWVIVDKDFFAKKGRAKNFDLKRAKRLKRCSFNDSKCVVTQSKSQRMNAKDKKTSFEDCQIIGNINFESETLPKIDKETVHQAFLTAYKAGNYFLEEVIVDGKVQSIETPGKRYEFTDTTYMHDNAADTLLYKGLETRDLTFENGQIKGKPKYNVGKGISSSYTLWGKSFLPTVVGVAGGTLASGVLFPAMLPVFAFSGMAYLVALPVIPVVNVIIGLVKNGTLSSLKDKKYPDKTETNRNQDVKDIESELKTLFAKKDDLTLDQVNDFYDSRILTKIISLSRTTNNNALRMVDGKAKINSSNVNLAIEQCERYQSNSTKMRRATNNLKVAQTRFDRQQKIIDDLKLKDKEPSKFRKWMYKRAEKKLGECQTKYDTAKEINDGLMNAVYGMDCSLDPRQTDLLNKASGLRLYLELTKDRESELWQLFEGMSPDEVLKSLKFDVKKGLLLDGKKVFDKDSTLERRDENWKALRDKVLKAIDKQNTLNEETIVEKDPSEEIVLPKSEEIDKDDLTREVIIENLKQYLKIHEDILSNTNDVEYFIRIINDLQIEKTNIEKTLQDETTTEEQKIILNKRLKEIKESLSFLEKAKQQLQNSINEFNALKEKHQKEIEKLEPKIFELIETDEEVRELYEKYKSTLTSHIEKEVENDEIEPDIEKEKPVSVNIELVVKNSKLIEEYLQSWNEIQEQLTEIEYKILPQLINNEIQLKGFILKAKSSKDALGAKELAQLEAQLSELKRNKQQLEAKKNELENKRKDYETTIQALEDEIQSMRGSDPTIDALIDTREINKARNEVEFEKARNEAIDAMAREASLSGKLKRTEDERTELSDENQKLKDENQNLINRLIAMENMIKESKKSMSNIDKLLIDIESRIASIDKEIEAKQKEHYALLDKIANSKNTKEINAQIGEYQSQLANVQESIDKKRKELKLYQEKAEEFRTTWEAGLTIEGQATHEENIARVEKIKQLLVQTAIQLKKIEELKIKKLKVEKDFDTIMNSEDNLKNLLLDRDEDLLEYLADQGVNVSEANIMAVIARIMEKHSNGKYAKTGADKLVNKSISEILHHGQTYITEHAKGNTIS